MVVYLIEVQRGVIAQSTDGCQLNKAIMLTTLNRKSTLSTVR